MLTRHARALCGVLLEARGCAGFADPFISQKRIPCQWDFVRNLARQRRSEDRKTVHDAADDTSMPQNAADDDEDELHGPVNIDLNYR